MDRLFLDMKHNKYMAPAILEDVDVELGCQLLAASMEVVKDTEVESVGQDVDTYNTTTFDSNWE